jgi:pseudouridine synthase
MRLHRFIAHCGTTSRRRAELLIEAGRVAVNGKTVSRLGQIVNPARDVVTVNGEEIRPPEPLTIIFHKPAGVITSTHDTHERLTVMDLLPKTVRDRGVLPVGRLDQDTEGLLILTNDGDLSHRIAHPRHETEKEYEAFLAGRPAAAEIARLEAGVRLEDGMTAPAVVAAVEPAPDGARVRLIIHEGRKRQVRRMFEAVGHEVLHLKRVRIGGLALGALPRGAWRELAESEVAALVRGVEAGTEAGTEAGAETGTEARRGAPRAEGAQTRKLSPGRGPPPRRPRPGDTPRRGGSSGSGGR